MARVLDLHRKIAFPGVIVAVASQHLRLFRPELTGYRAAQRNHTLAVPDKVLQRLGLYIIESELVGVVQYDHVELPEPLRRHNRSIIRDGCYLEGA
jgi:hypothetical protein